MLIDKEGTLTIVRNANDKTISFIESMEQQVVEYDQIWKDEMYQNLKQSEIERHRKQLKDILSFIDWSKECVIETFRIDDNYEDIINENSDIE